MPECLLDYFGGIRDKRISTGESTQLAKARNRHIAATSTLEKSARIFGSSDGGLSALAKEFNLQIALGRSRHFQSIKRRCFASNRTLHEGKQPAW